MSDTKENSGLSFATMSDAELKILRNNGGLCDHAMSALNDEISSRKPVEQDQSSSITYAEALRIQAKEYDRRLFTWIAKRLRYILIVSLVAASVVVVLWLNGITGKLLYGKVFFGVMILDFFRRALRNVM